MPVIMPDTRRFAPDPMAPKAKRWLRNQLQYYFSTPPPEDERTRKYGAIRAPRSSDKPASEQFADALSFMPVGMTRTAARDTLTQLMKLREATPSFKLAARVAREYLDEIPTGVLDSLKRIEAPLVDSLSSSAYAQPDPQWMMNSVNDAKFWKHFKHTKLTKHGSLEGTPYIVGVKPGYSFAPSDIAHELEHVHHFLSPHATPEYEFIRRVTEPLERFGYINTAPSPLAKALSDVTYTSGAWPPRMNAEVGGILQAVSPGYRRLDKIRQVDYYHRPNEALAQLRALTHTPKYIEQAAAKVPLSSYRPKDLYSHYLQQYLQTGEGNLANVMREMEQGPLQAASHELPSRLWGYSEWGPLPDILQPETVRRAPTDIEALQRYIDAITP